MTITAQLADGRTLEFPDDTDPSVVQATVKRLVGGGGPSVMDAPLSAHREFAAMPGWQRALVGAGAEFTDMIEGAKQRAVRPLNAIGLVSDETREGVDKAWADKQANDTPMANDPGAKIGRFTAAAATGLLPVGTVKGAAALASVLGALAPTENEQQAVVNMLISGGMGAVGQALGNKLASWMKGSAKPAPLTSADLSVVREMERRGYKLTPAQIGNDPSWRSLETQIASLPGGSGKMAAHRAGQKELFTRDLFATMGEPPPVGGSIGMGKTGATQAAIGSRLEAAATGQPMAVDSQMFQELAATLQKHERLLSPDQRAIVNQYIESIPARFDGADYQRWRAQIGARAASATDSELKGALKGIQRALDSAFDRQATPDAAKAMRAARGEYRNFKTLEPLLKKAEAAGEPIAPMQVAQRASTAGNLGGDVAELGVMGRIIGKEGPNSGTAQNQFWRNLMTGTAVGTGMGGGALGGYLVGDGEGAAVGGTLGGAATLAAMLGGPRVGASAYLSKVLRDRALQGAEKAARKAAIPPSAMATMLRQFGTEQAPLIEAMVRSGAIGLPALAASE